MRVIVGAGIRCQVQKIITRFASDFQMFRYDNANNEPLYLSFLSYSRSSPNTRPDNRLTQCPGLTMWVINDSKNCVHCLNLSNAIFVTEMRMELLGGFFYYYFCCGRCCYDLPTVTELRFKSEWKGK